MPDRPEGGATTARHLATIAAILILTSCGGTDKPDVAGCEQAMQQQYDDAKDKGAKGERPSECEGISDAKLEEIASRILSAEVGGAETTTAPQAGPDAFMAAIAEQGFGQKDTSDPAFVGIGNTTCQGFSDGVSYGQQVDAFVSSDAAPTQSQAENFVRAAVQNLCPEHSDMLP